MVQLIRCLSFSLSFVLIVFYSNAQKPFTEVSKSAGIDHQFIVFEGSFGGGAVAFDYNNDGFEDIFLAGGQATDALYLNKGNGSFENVYERSGLKTDVKYISQGAVSADVNKDGWRDLFICTINSSANKEKIPRAPNLLFINNGNGTFRNATMEYGLDKYYSFTTAAMFGDVNNDGFPDIYVGNYFKEFAGKLSLIDDAVIVGSKQMAKGYLLINKEGKYFEDEYDKYGLKHKGFGFGGVFTDYDNDNDLDLIVNHDFGYKNTPNKLYENKYPEEQFEDVSEKMKMNLPMNAMGTAVGDYNNDGLMDYYVTNIKGNFFMVNKGKEKPFVNESQQLGTKINSLHDKEGTYMSVGWGANFADFDNDGDLDLFVANGCLNPYIEPNPDLYFENNNGLFVNRSDENNLNDRGVGRGSLYFDYDNDGDLDLLVVNQRPVDSSFANASKTLLFRNDSARGNWLKVQLAGVYADKNGIGARVEVIAGNLRMCREIDGGSSHSSQNSVIAHFGLKDIKSVDTVRVIWTGGNEQILVNQKTNQLIKITETGGGRKSTSVSWLLIAGGAILAVILLILFYVRAKR